MSEYLALLKEPLEWDWKIKYFSIRWLQVYGPTQTVEKPVKSIAVDLDVTDKVVSLALSSLDKAGFLARKKIIHGKGRPRHSYKWVRGNLSTWSAADNHPAHHHLHLIDHVLGSGEEAFTDASAHKLDRQNRLLLAVLLAHADRCGAVRGLSQAQLGTITGMDKRAVSRRIRALGAEGYIRSYCPGIRGYRLFGAAPGMYFLNLSHSVYGSNGAAGFVTFFEWDVGQVEEVMFEGREVFLLASGIRSDMRKGRQRSAERRLSSTHTLPPVDPSLIELAHMFEPSPSSNRPDGLAAGGYAAGYFQRKIEEYASCMLSERWQELAERCCVYVPDLLGRIEIDLQPPSRRTSIQITQRSRSEPYRQLAIFIYLTAQQLAQRVASWMRLLPNIDGAEMRHCILPALTELSRAPVRAVISFYKEQPAGAQSNGIVRARSVFWSSQDLETSGLHESRLCEEGFDDSGRCIAVGDCWSLLVERVEKESDLPVERREASGLAMMSAALHLGATNEKPQDT